MNALDPSLFIQAELGMLFDVMPQSPPRKQVRELIVNLRLPAALSHNLSMIDVGWVDGAVVSPQAQAYQIRHALPVSCGNISKFSCCNHRARGCCTLIYRQR